MNLFNDTQHTAETSIFTQASHNFYLFWLNFGTPFKIRTLHKIFNSFKLLMISLALIINFI